MGFQVSVGIIGKGFLCPLRVPDPCKLSSRKVTVNCLSSCFICNTLHIAQRGISIISALPKGVAFFHQISVSIIFHGYPISKGILRLDEISFPVIPIGIVDSFFPVDFHHSSKGIINKRGLCPVFIFLSNPVSIGIVGIAYHSAVCILDPG